MKLFKTVLIHHYLAADLVRKEICRFVYDDDQWRYSPDRALASLYGFHDSL
jgi:hypothetical protein